MTPTPGSTPHSTPDSAPNPAADPTSGTMPDPALSLAAGASAAPGSAPARVHAHELPGGSAWSAPVAAGRTITLTALADGANASMLIIGADRLDRLNIPDTLKSQMSARIKPGMVLMSDRGLALATVVASTLDWHDCLTGTRPDQLLLLELAKHGFTEADLHGCINFFTKVAVADDPRASLAYIPNHAHTGDTVALRADQNLLIFISTAPHALSPASDAISPAPHAQSDTPAAQSTAPHAASSALAGPSNTPARPSNAPSRPSDAPARPSDAPVAAVAVRIGSADGVDDPDLREEAVRALRLTRELIA